jgi:putative membrane protein
MLKVLVARIVVVAAAFLVVDALMDTVVVNGGFTGAVGLAVVYGIVSAVIGTVLRLLALPLILLSLGLFEFVIGGVLLLLVEALTDWIELDRFWTAIGAAFVLAVVSAILGLVLGAVFPETKKT